MQKTQLTKANILGELVAEDDHEMLEKGFYETQDYKTLIEGGDAPVVVGRRGSGKSALFYRVAKRWKETGYSHVLTVTAEENQVFALRQLLELFGNKYNRIKSGMRIAWRYALLMELGSDLIDNYKVRGSEAAKDLAELLKVWKYYENRVGGIIGKLRAVLITALDTKKPVDERIGDLAANLNLPLLESTIKNVLTISNTRCLVLVDKLDEGYEPDVVGTGFVAGVIYGTIDLNRNYEQLRSVVFVRDNIFRSFMHDDPDYSRNVEGKVLRLHWDENELFNLVCNRLRLAFDSDIENNTKLWKTRTGRSLQDKDGFRKCLRLTLYRPRDVVSLLNNAFYTASKHKRLEIVQSDIDTTAKEISEIRLDDLFKEYSAVIPGIREYVSIFANGDPEVLLDETEERLSSVLSSDSNDIRTRQDFAIHGTPVEVIKSLHSVGFLGVYSKTTSHYAFSHDGRTPVNDFRSGDKLLVHPCYWLALNVLQGALEKEDAEEIYDEYDIKVYSENPQIRQRVFGDLINRLTKIPIGADGSSAFEVWCQEVIKRVFSGSLVNVELKPNRNARQRRDVVGTNQANEDTWNWIRDEYRSRQVVFEIKNYEDLKAEDFQQLWGYLTGEYGRMGFFVTRSSVKEPTNNEIEWIRLGYDQQKKLCVKLTSSFLEGILSRMVNPQKHSAADEVLRKLLNSYTRLYLQGQGVEGSSQKKKKRKQKRNK